MVTLSEEGFDIDLLYRDIRRIAIEREEKIRMALTRELKEYHVGYLEALLCIEQIILNRRDNNGK